MTASRSSVETGTTPHSLVDPYTIGSSVINTRFFMQKPGIVSRKGWPTLEFHRTFAHLMRAPNPGNKFGWIDGRYLDLSMTRYNVS